MTEPSENLKNSLESDDRVTESHFEPIEQTQKESHLNDPMSPQKAFKIKPHKGVKITDSIKEDLRNKYGCRLDTLHNAYICHSGQKESVKEFFKEKGVNADLIDVTDFSPNKDKKINSLENQIEHLNKKLIKERGDFFEAVSACGEGKALSDFRDLPKYEDFPEDESKEKKDARFAIEMGFHKKFLECEELAKEIENLENSLSLHKNELEKNILRCGDYIVEAKGLYYFPEQKADELDPASQYEEQKKVWISSPIWPEAYLRDKDGQGHTLLIRVHDGEKNHKIPLPRRVITKWSELSEILLDLGQKIPMNPTKQQHLKDFLQFTIPERKMRCVYKAGWHEDQYVFPDGEVIGKTSNSESVYPINKELPKGLKQKGTHADWLKNVWELCAYNSRLIFSVGVSLAAPCMYLIDEDSGGFSLVGASSIGKSRCLAVAISVFGSPDFKRSWRNTSNGFEALCALHNDLLLPMDEGGQADPKEIGENIYMFSQGQGKGRMYKDTSVRDSKDWRAMLLSTAEKGLNTLMQEGKKIPKPGQLVRIADIPAAVKNGFGCFECLHGYENGIDGELFAEKIKSSCREYYGTAGREFIRAIINYGIENAKEDLNNLSSDFSADLAREYDGQVKRVANRFGLVYAALSLAIKLNVLKGSVTDDDLKKSVTDCFKSWLGNRGTTGSMETHDLIQQVEGLLNENADSKFIPKNDVNDTRIRQTLWGYKDGAIFYVFNKAFKGLCDGYDEQQAKIILTDAKLLLPGSGGKFSQSIKLPAHPKKDRYYVIDLNNIRDDVEEA